MFKRHYAIYDECVYSKNTLVPAGVQINSTAFDKPQTVVGTWFFFKFSVRTKINSKSMKDDEKFA